MRYGIITVPVTDIRAEPNWRSERLSQILFGAAVSIDDIVDEYSHIILADGYAGWCRTGHLTRIPHPAWKKYLTHPKHLIKPAFIPIGDKSNRNPPFILFFATEVVVSHRAGKGMVVLPNGFSATIDLRHVTPAPTRAPDRATGRHIVATAKRFLGTPYLWGGLTPCGFDCSGLVQAVFKFHGIRLPRDSKDQRRAGDQIEQAELRPGDLLFFPGHVAISCGSKDFIHASAGRGMVTIDSLDSKAPNYRPDLDKSFNEARRVWP